MPVEKMVLFALVMAGITYLIRMIPLTFFRKKIKSRFLLSFFYYIPYTVLTAMTFPGIFYYIGDTFAISALIGAIVAIIASLFDRSLTTVAICAFLACLIAQILL